MEHPARASSESFEGKPLSGIGSITTLTLSSGGGAVKLSTFYPTWPSN
jgi:hypothetical protein